MTYCLKEMIGAEQHGAQLPFRQKAQAVDAFSRIAVNHEASKAAYTSFIATLSYMCKHATQLLEKQGKPRNSIMVQEEGLIHEKNYLYCFSSYKRSYKTVLTLNFPYVKRHYYKHIRIISFPVPQGMGGCDISVKDFCLVKKRIKHYETENASGPSNTGFSRTNQIFPCNISDLNRDTANKILGWLLFKTELKSLPFAMSILTIQPSEQRMACLCPERAQ